MKSSTPVISFPSLPECECEFHARQLPPQFETGLEDPLSHLPPPIEFTDEMDAIANRYLSHDIDWRYYPAFQAAAFLRPKSPELHSERRKKYLSLKTTAESEGFSIPDTLTRLFTNDSFVDRLHHNCVWLALPDELVRLPTDPRFALFSFLIEGQGGGWHLLLAPNGSHRIVTADDSFGRRSSYPPEHSPNPTAFRIYQCLDSIDRLLLFYFLDSARHDVEYVERLQHFFPQHGTE